eukprot:jgi/Picsp_1/5692/NSC_03051-R1_---NA---
MDRTEGDSIPRLDLEEPRLLEGDENVLVHFLVHVNGVLEPRKMPSMPQSSVSDSKLIIRSEYSFETTIKFNDCTLAKLMSNLACHMLTPVLLVEAVWPTNQEPLVPYLVCLDSEVSFRDVVNTVVLDTRRKVKMIQLFAHDRSSNALFALAASASRAAKMKKKSKAVNFLKSTKKILLNPFAKLSSMETSNEKETANTTNTNTASTTHSRTAEGKKGKRAFKKLVTRASKIAHKVMDGVHMSCMPRTRRASNSDRQRFHRDEMEGHPVSPTIKAIRAGAPHDRSLAESIDNGDNTNSKVDTNRNGMLKAKLKAMTTTLQWKRPMETIKRASLCLPCLSGSAAVTKA